MLLDCDLSVIKGDETICTAASTSVKVSKNKNDKDSARLRKGKRDVQMRHLLKKIKAASKVQNYLLQECLPNATAQQQRELIETDLIKLTCYVTSCCNKCLAADEEYRLYKEGKNKGKSEDKQFIVSSDKLSAVDEFKTPPRIDQKEVSATYSGSSLNAKSFDRLMTKLISPSSTQKKCETGSVYDKDSPSCKPPVRRIHDHASESEECLKSIEDWSEVKKFLHRKPSPNLADRDKASPSFHHRNSPGSYSHCSSEKDDEYSSQESRPPSPPSDDEQVDHDMDGSGAVNTDNSRDCVDMETPAEFFPVLVDEDLYADNYKTNDHYNKEKELDAKFSNNSVVILAGSDSDQPPPPSDIDRGLAEFACAEPETVDDDITLPVSQYFAEDDDVLDSVSDQDKSIVVGKPEVTWSTEFNSTQSTFRAFHGQDKSESLVNANANASVQGQKENNLNTECYALSSASSLYGLRRNAKSKEGPTCPFGSPALTTRHVRHIMKPKQKGELDQSIPGNHFNLRQVRLYELFATICLIYFYSHSNWQRRVVMTSR